MIAGRITVATFLLWIASTVVLCPAAELGTIPLDGGGIGNYWVFFGDKGIDSAIDYQAALAALETTYDARSLERRRQRGTHETLFGYHDLPVAELYVSAVLGIGATLRHETSWLNAVSIQATSAQLDAVRQFAFVDRVQPVATLSRPSDAFDVQDVAAPSISQAGAAGFYGNAEAQLDQIRIIDVHQTLGFTGAGITIGVLDTGFRRSHVAFNEPGHVINVLGEKDFVAEPNDNDTSFNPSDHTNQHVHGTWVLATMAAYKPNTLVGGAYDASFLLAKTEDISQEVTAEEDDWVAGLQWLEANGADLVTSSLGYINWYTQAQLDGNTAVSTIAADLAAAAGLPIINAAGNEGHDGNPGTSSLIAPADGDLVITVGAVNSSGTIANFSSSGPTADGRLKPEVLARGVSTQTVNPNNNTLYQGVSGTSLATPLVASTVALMLQANPNLTVPQLRQLLFSTASAYDSPDPLYIRGYGIIDAFAAVEAAMAFEQFAVPEPASVCLIAIGGFLLMLHGFARRRTRARRRR